MRDWATKKTANWWIKANHNYSLRMENEPSESYLRDNFKFDSVLEVGSGTGRLINKLPGIKGAIDINPYLLEQIDNDIKKYNIDISKKNNIHDRYELVFTFQVLQHLNHEQFIKALINIKRLAKKEIWLMEGIDKNAADGQLTDTTGSYNHDYAKYLKSYQIDNIHGGKIRIFRAKK